MLRYGKYNKIYKQKTKQKSFLFFVLIFEEKKVPQKILTELSHRDSFPKLNFA